MAYRYRVRDGDGDVSTIEFEFDYEQGLILMEADSKQLIAVKGYVLPSDRAIATTLERFAETDEIEVDDSDAAKKTLLVLLADEWCDSASKIFDAVRMFEASLMMAYSVPTIKALFKEVSGEDAGAGLPRIRTNGTGFLWDSFVYMHEQELALVKDTDRRRDIEDYIKSKTDNDEFSVANTMPKGIGCWTLPVKIYPDQDYVVVRVPYAVMEDIYEEWKKRQAPSFDGNALDGLPQNITDEINALFTKFNKSHD